MIKEGRRHRVQAEHTRREALHQSRILERAARQAQREAEEKDAMGVEQSEDDGWTALPKKAGAKKVDTSKTALHLSMDQVVEAAIDEVVEQASKLVVDDERRAEKERREKEKRKARNKSRKEKARKEREEAAAAASAAAAAAGSGEEAEEGGKAYNGQSGGEEAPSTQGLQGRSDEEERQDPPAIQFGRAESSSSTEQGFALAALAPLPLSSTADGFKLPLAMLEPLSIAASDEPRPPLSGMIDAADLEAVLTGDARTPTGPPPPRHQKNNRGDRKSVV